MGRPVFISYITSNSMEPTLKKGDVIFLTPIYLNLEEGDIIVFNSNGEWVCHRIFVETSSGYITKGDNNIATDQQSGKDPVKPENIAGKVVTFLGNPLKIPKAGNYLEKVSDFTWKHKTFVLLLFVIAGIFDVLGGHDSKKKKERRKKYKKYITVSSNQLFLITVFCLMMINTFAGTIWIGYENIQYGVTSAGGAREEWVLPGEKFTRNLTIFNYLYYPMIYVIKGGENSFVEEEFVLWPGESKTITVKIQAPLETRIYNERILVAKYFPILPPEMIYRISSINEYLPVIALNFEILLILSIIYFLSGEKDNYYRIRRRRRMSLKPPFSS